MIERFRIENYKALRDITLGLTPVHALIGPNDSGKTSILCALVALSRSTDRELPQAFVGSWDGRELVWHGDPEGIIRFSASISQANDKLDYLLSCRFPNAGRNVVVEDEKIYAGKEINCARRNHSATKVFGVSINNENAPEDLKQTCRSIHESLSGMHYQHWNARALALPVAPDSARRFRMNSDGFGLALFLDDILGYDRKRFMELEDRFCAVFPEIASIKLIPQMGFRSPPDDVEQVSRLNQADGKGLHFQLRGTRQLVPAAQASDGALLILAYLAILFSPEPPRLLLVEEPENGIHPKRLQDVFKILRDLVTEKSETQVILTTHSPYAVDLLNPDEVTLCTKRDDRTIGTMRLSDSKSIRDQLSVFTLGEIWTAEGDARLAAEPAIPSP